MAATLKSAVGPIWHKIFIAHLTYKGSPESRKKTSLGFKRECKQKLAGALISFTFPDSEETPVFLFSSILAEIIWPIQIYSDVCCIL